MSIISEEFWLSNPSYLFRPILVPESHMNLEAQLNALTRLIIIIGIILFSLKFKFYWIFIILSLLMIIIVYYCKMSQRENYSSSNFPQTNYPFESYGEIMKNRCPRADVGYPQENLSFVQANRLSTYNKTDVGVDFFSPPIQIQERSMIPPIIVPKAFDKEVWTPNDGVNQTDINSTILEDVTFNFLSNENCAPNEKLVVGKAHKGLTNAAKLMSADENAPSYVGDYMNLPTDTLFNQDIQPKKDFSYFVERHQPINGNYAISEIPDWNESPEKVYYNRESHRNIERMPNKRGFASYGAYDPQLVRDSGPAGRLAEMPIRSEWSARLSSHDPTGTIDYNSIFDPRFTGYGDPYRSYLDVDKGQISYYYGDVDAYRHPVFIGRSKVDFIEDREPMGKIRPMYRRERSMCLNDAIEEAENRFVNDTTSFRESIMGSQMAKRNSEMWQMRYFPKRLMNSR